ncbi:hypothetical protein N665_0144s0037 [Sinapis alba]|nr:hypothetical protein N665_0144s0037 [Sinapis alba]
MSISKISVIFFLIIVNFMSNYNVLAKSRQRECGSQCTGGRSGDRACHRDCVRKGFDYGSCGRPPKYIGKCCCTYFF